MTLERKLARLFKLTDENWMKHANPWSVWTRYSVLPVIVLAFWSRVWIGWWYVIPVIISLAWMFLNPVFFSRARSTKNWASKAVLGERVWMNRDKIDVPEYHKLPLNTECHFFVRDDTNDLGNSNAVCMAGNIRDNSGIFKEKLVPG